MENCYSHSGHVLNDADTILFREDVHGYHRSTVTHR
jgi:hypothetical protein